MNNGRVRIYELSRELNLENKDILTICEQLNIAVKSHSSTITEEEAAQIRASADSIPVGNGTAHSTGGTAPAKPNIHPSKPVSRSQTMGNRPILQKKQQILEIRKPPARPIETSDASVDAVGNGLDAPSAAPSPEANLASPAAASMTQQLVSPAHPARTEIAKPSGEFSSTNNLASSPESATPPSMNTAPQRPAATANPSRLSERPIIKRKGDVAQPTASPVADSASPGAQTPAEPAAEPSRTVVRPRIIRESTIESAQRAENAEVRELQRPRLVKPNAAHSTTLAPPERPLDSLVPPLKLKRPGGAPADPSDDKTATTTPTPSPELKRPNLPRGPKRGGRSWEEEEADETPDFKAAKAGLKSKRRTATVDDDIDLDDITDIDDIEDLEEDDLDIGNQIVQATLSIARPAKPKVPKAAAAPKPAAAAPKPKRGGDSENRGRGRRDRREVEPAQRPEKLILAGSMTVQELATAMVLPESTIIKTLFFKGIAANINQALDLETIKMVAEELEMPVETAEKESEARKVEVLDMADLENLQRRPPVVTIMGHVDHGKTSLLDAIRKTKVAQGEAGGITQHIGAYHVDVQHEGQTQQVVFLDTPGHEAFTAMRARGARVTDVAILVVAADDGVQPQTVEAISHAKAAKVPIIVAINKIDKEGAQPERVKQELTEYELVPEEWGGSTVMVPVSAITQENLDSLLEMILLVSEVEDLSANPDRMAKGTVIEAHLDKAKGAVATLLIQNGTLRVGDVLVAGPVLGKVRAMVDDRGRRVDTAAPSFAVEVLGLGGVPAAGDDFEVFKDEKEARAIADSRTDQQRQSRLQQALSSRRVSLNNLSARAQEGELKELNLVLKADVQGSLEAIIGSLNQLPQNQVQLRVLFSAPGEISETDVDLAAASDAVIIGFNTTFASGARQAADRAGVDVREYSIIYKLLDDVQGAMEGLLDPELVEEPLGQAEVRAVFPVGKGSVAGCYILSGKVVRNCKVRVLRGSAVIHEGILDSLKRMKEDTREVNSGYECGIGLDSFSTWKEGDIIEAFRMVAKRRSLTPA